MRGALPLSLLLLAPLTAACGSDATRHTTLRILADSSLTEVLDDMAVGYTQTHPGVTVRTAYGGSQEMASQLEQPVDHSDVIITADPASLDEIAEHVTGRRYVARNSLTIAVAPGNPYRIRGLYSLTRPRIRFILGTPTGPTGRQTLQALAKAGVTVRPRSEETDARAVLGRIRGGEADAGLVYITDMKSAGAAASSVAIPASQNVSAVYPAAVGRRSRHAAQAAAFVKWLTTDEAVALFHKYGFQSP